MIQHSTALDLCPSVFSVVKIYELKEKKMPKPTSIQILVNHLTTFPHRANNTKDRNAIFKILKDSIQSKNIKVEEQAFRTPAHFLQIVLCLILGFIVALTLSGFNTIASALIALFFFVASVLYFDWRPSILTKIPPLVDTANFIATNKTKSAKKRIILMAHWDSAPITFPYRPAMLKNFRSSLYTNVGLMLVTVLTCVCPLIITSSNHYLSYLQYFLIAYFIVQLFLVYVDFWRFGYSNGANDNATGCAAAFELANYLWKISLTDVEVELCITGAEEVGMLGAKVYLDALQERKKMPTYVINFDTVGCEHLQIITSSRTFTTNSYNSVLMDIASQVAKDQNSNVRFKPYRTADVDTVSFARAGIPCLSFISENDDGLPAHIHRPEDVVNNLHWETIDHAVDLAKAICDNIVSNPAK